MLSRISLRFKITLLVVSIVSVASTVFGRFAYSGIGNLLTRATGLGAETAAEALADTIDSDWFKSWEPGPELTHEYQAIKQRLELPIVKGTVTLIEVTRVDWKNREVLQVFSVPEDQTEDYVKPGTVQRLDDSPVYQSTKSGHLPVLLSKPGYYMAGWAPITENGKPIGFLLLATDVSAIKATLDTISLAIAGTMLALVLLSGLVAFKFATAFEKSAVTDGLMGIYNHKFFKQRLEQEVAKARRYGQQTSLVLLDIDYFKRVNDTYGHATGDLVLKHLAKWVSDSCRTTDVVARYGGEEIAVLLPHTGLAGAQEFAERLRMKVSTQVIHDSEEDVQFRVTISVGVAQWEKGMDFLDMIKHADAALYFSKNTGRNRVSIYQEDLLPSLGQAPQQATAGHR